jgi:hypothetical protein
MLIPFDTPFPRIVLVEQDIPAPLIDDVPGAIRAEIARLGVAARVRPGMRIAVTAGSRGITGIPMILRTVASEIKRMGAVPFLVPCMGSHGGATADGQLAVLHSLGITEESVGCPIHSSMDTVQIGETPEGIPVLIDTTASRADGIVVVNRIKAHTEYTGPVESGWMKMLAIGLGKHEGALRAHRNAVQLSYRVAIVSVAREIIRRAPLIFGLGVVENAYDRTAEVVAAWPQDFEAAERGLLNRAKELMPRLPFQELDVLIVDEIGKELSGAGLDPNIIGRRMVFGEPELATPKITRIVVCDLTDKSAGSAVGIGLADYTTQRLVDKLDPRPTYINCLTAMAPEKARIPMTAANDREAIEWALLTSGAVEPPRSRLVRIKNTLHLETFYASESLLPELKGNPRLKVVGEWAPLSFDEAGKIQPEHMEK